MAASLLSNNLPAPEPVFPRFKPLTLADREIFRRILWDYQAETSELTFTNLFIWQSHYGYQWSLDRDRLLVVSTAGAGQPGPCRRWVPRPGWICAGRSWAG